MGERYRGRDWTGEFEGRALARPDEDVVDQRLGFDVGTRLGCELTVSDLANGGAAFQGVAVYVWHRDRRRARGRPAGTPGGPPPGGAGGGAPAE